MKKGRVNAKYEEKYIKANRTFPVGSTVLLVLIVAAQIGLVIFGIVFQPKPRDLIHQYRVTVAPLEDGSLDIEYSFLWEAKDEILELTWVEIGMANQDFAVYPDSVSDNISTYSKYTDGDYVSLELYFEDSYVAGETVEFSFKVNQRNMLCQNNKGYFYEFVPCWFNAIQVEEYEFTWLGEDEPQVWRGSLNYGEYCKMFVQYGTHDFAGCQVADYFPFDDDGAYNELEDLKAAIVVFCLFVALFLIIPEVYIIDSYVSYDRGRGFLTGYGYHVHTYGRSNPYYIRERDKRNARYGGRSGGGGGCACACACACAGGGRAGCSQKDTYGSKPEAGDIR